MAGYIFGLPPFAAPAGWITNSASTNYPAANAGLYWRPYAVARTAANCTAGTSFFGAIFSQAQSMGAVVIDNIDIAAVKVQCGNWNGTAFTVTASQDVSAGTCIVDGRRKAYVDTSLMPAAIAWRVLANETPSPAVPLQVGSVLFVPASNVLTWPMGSAEWQETYLQAAQANELAGGGAEPVILGNPYASISLDLVPASYATQRGPLFQVLRQGRGNWLVLYKNADDTSEVYICRLEADVAVRQTASSAIQARGITFVEAV